MDFKRALVRVLKGTFCKSIRRLLEAKRACIGFELSENSLQTSGKMGISDALLKHCINLYSNPNTNSSAVYLQSVSREMRANNKG